MKLCKDCKHGHVGVIVPFDTCCRSVWDKGIDLRNGDQVFSGWRSSKDERRPGRIMARLTGRCGKEGRFWEAKP